ELAHGIQGRQQGMHAVSHVHPYFSYFREDQGFSSTVIIDSPNTLGAPVLDARMVAVPTPTAVTSPVEGTTVATSTSSDDHTTPEGAPTGATVAVRVACSPTSRVRVAGSTVTLVTSGASGSGVSSTIRPKSDAVAEASKL